MPATPGTPRRSSNTNNRRSAPTTPKSADVQGLGIHGSITITDRIRQWQEQGATIVAPIDTGSDISSPGHEERETGDRIERPAAPTPGGRGNQKPDYTTSKRKSPTKWVDPENREWVRKARNSSTPKKRVISDEHWKKDRVPKDANSAPPTPKRLSRHEEEDHGTPHDTLTREERDERRRRRRKTRSPRNNEEPRNNDDGIRVYATPPSTRRQSAESELVFDENPRRPDEDEEDVLQNPIAQKSPRQSTGSHRRRDRSPAEKNDKKQQGRSQYAETLDKSPTSTPGAFGEPLPSVRSKKGGIFSQAKEIFTKSDPAPIPGLRLPSIEAWLEDQPDPFLDDEDPPVEVPAPLKTKSRRKKIAVEETIHEDTSIPHVLVETHDDSPAQPTESTRRRKRRSQTSTENDRTPVIEVEHATRNSRPISPISEEPRQNSPDRSPVILRRKAPKSTKAESDVVPPKESTHLPRSRRLPDIPKDIPEVSNTHASGQERRPRPQRPCPPTGLHRLSTIASVETFHAPPETEDPDMLAQEGNGLKRRLTTHEDLMSVLSQPRARKSKSVRSSRNQPRSTSIEQIFEELASDESKYMRELRTLVDGVIPVLLQCVLSKSDSIAAAGLFTSSGTARDDLNFTKPIVDMGIALERLKMLHKRIPLQNLDSLISWATGAQKVYAEYLSAWRLGFQDVVVNLAPADGNARTEVDQGMARDANGDIVNAEGKKVDVAYLLKRPLIRIKNLGKVFNALKALNPSTKLIQVAEAYDDLVATARRRSNEEQGRLEDEAAGNIDASKARDLRTLAVLSNVKIDGTRRVNARDCFNLTLQHSTGQRIDCRVELLLRDNPPDLPPGGDLLLCEVEDSGRWLFFPPIDKSCLSARAGDADGELVVMVRGDTSRGRQWHELLCLKADYAASTLEWVQMLGLQPMPPEISRSLSFVKRQQLSSPRPDTSSSTTSTPFISRAPSPRDIEVPIGEPSVLGGCEDERPSSAPERPQHTAAPPSSDPPLVSEHSRFSIHQVISSLRSSKKPLPAPPKVSSDGLPPSASAERSDLSISTDETRSSSAPTLRRTKAARRRNTRTEEDAPISPLVADSPTTEVKSTPENSLRKLSRTDNASREWMSSPDTRHLAPSEPDNDGRTPGQERQVESTVAVQVYHSEVSSTPSKETPTLPRARPTSQDSTPLNDKMRDEWAALSAVSTQKRPKTRTKQNAPRDRQTQSSDIVSPTASTQGSGSPSRPLQPHSTSRRPISTQQEVEPPKKRSLNTPETKPKGVASSRPSHQGERRSSSPLKHEYAPSVESESYSDSDSDSSIISSSSDTSEDAVIEFRDVPTDLVPIGAAPPYKPRRSNPPASVATLASASLAPSNSASQGPYRTVPTVSQASGRSAKTIAMVCSWSEKGIWESLHPDECSILVSPGLIQAFEMSAAHSGTNGQRGEAKVDSGPSSDVSSYVYENSSDIRPLVAFELTPLVPLRRGTALDISIRSPPTENSKIRTSNNIMFRSRNAEECEVLYSMINYARINNPTYIALQNARPSYQPPVTFNTGTNRRGSRSKGGSWFSFGSGSHAKQSSYRASSAAMPSSASIGGASESSIGSMSSAFSALRRFGGGAKEGTGMFNLNRSSVLRKNGPSGRSGNTSLYSSSSGTTRTGSGSEANSPAPSQLGLPLKTSSKDAHILESVEGGSGGTIGPAYIAGSAGVVNNMKIRLYMRQADLRWRDLGAGRLSVLQPPTVTTTEPQTPPDVHLATTKDVITPPSTAPGGTAATPSLSATPSLTINHPKPTTTNSPNNPHTTNTTTPRLPSSSHTPHRIHNDGREKRILITAGKDKSHILLDAVLGESCFERQGRIGIALSVWMEDQMVKKEGGVVGGRGQMYMIQLRGEAEASWVFGLVGGVRY